MAYMDYEYTPRDTLYQIATQCGITETELLRINNITVPVVSDYIYNIPGLNGTIKVPETASGGVSVEGIPREFDSIYTNNVPTKRLPRTEPIVDVIGDRSQGQCQLKIEGHGTVYFPCFPESWSDSRTANFSSQNPLGRSEPFQIYENSGPRTVSVSFKMHREMNHWTEIEKVVAAVQACTYPTTGAVNSVVPQVELYLGDACYIKGIIAGGVDVTWSETINKNFKYNVAELSFTVTECTGNPKVFANVYSANGK